jgi:predicted RNA-binding protein
MAMVAPFVAHSAAPQMAYFQQRTYISKGFHVTDHANWIITGSVENFRSTRDNGFKVQGLKSRHRKTAAKIKPGDRITWYITGVKAFGATATVTSEYFEDHTPIWKSASKKRDDEDYPYRFAIEADIVLPEADFIDAEPVARQLTHVSKWPAANWTLAFQGNIRPIDDDDFALIENALKTARGALVTSGD